MTWKLVGVEVRAALRFSSEPDLEAQMDAVMELLEDQSVSPAIGVNLATGEVEITIYLPVDDDREMREVAKVGIGIIEDGLSKAGVPLDHLDDEEFHARPSRELIAV